MHLSRRELLNGIAGVAWTSAFGLSSFGLASGPESKTPLSSIPDAVYFSSYSLSGIMAVFAKTPYPDEQYLAANMLALKSRLLGHDHLLQHHGRLAAFEGGVSIDDIGDHVTTPFLCVRGSDPYTLLTGIIPDGWRERVVRVTDWFAIHPNVISTRDSSQFTTGGVALEGKGFLVEPQEFPSGKGIVQLAALMVHEAEHLATMDLPPLRTELAAYRAQRGVINTAIRNGIPGLEEYLAGTVEIVRTGEYLADDRFHGAFDDVYPRVRVFGEHLVEARVHRDALEKYRSVDTGDTEMDTIFRLACRQALEIVDYRTVPEEIVASLPQAEVQTIASRQRILDPGFDTPIILRG